MGCNCEIVLNICLITYFFSTHLLTNQKKVLPLQCVFHGIRIKVNEDWLSGDNQFFFVPTRKHPSLHT